jgi:hypothetical protein
METATDLLKEEIKLSSPPPPTKEGAIAPVTPGPKVVVGLSTIPSRIPYLEKTLASLSKQSLKPDNVFISVSKVSTREKVEYPIKELTHMMRKFFPKGVGKVAVTPEDYGPLTKLAGMLMNPANSNPNTIMVTVDDDQSYDSGMLATLVEGTKKHPGKVVCLCGHVIGKFPLSWGYRSDRASKYLKRIYLNPDTQVDIVSGWCGVAYPRSVFPLDGELDPGMEDLRLNSIPVLHKHDDLYISAWLDKLGVKKVVVAYNNGSSKQLQHAYKNALSMGNSGPTPAVGIKHLREFWYVIRQLRSKGLLCSKLKVKWHKSTVVLATLASILLLAASATLAVVLTKKFLLQKRN